MKLGSYSKNKLAFSLIELSIVILVVGILIAGVVTGSEMITKAKVATAANQTKASVVPSIKNLVFWVETSSSGSVVGSNAADSVPFDGDTVSKWNDINPQSSFKINPVASGSSRPIYKEKGINGLPSILFDNVDDFLDVSGISISKNHSFFAVFNVFGVINRRDILAITNGGHGILLEIRPANLIRKLYRTPTGASGGDEAISLIAISDKKNYIISNVRNYDTSSDKIWLNNSIFIDAAATFGDLNYSTQTITIGNMGDGTTRPLDGQISEVIIYNRALKQDEINDVQAYLSKKYNITLN